MSHNQINYLQNYQNYYQSAPKQYDEYYADEIQDLKQNYDEVTPDLQVPSSRLYTEGYHDDNEIYEANAQFNESQQHQQVENSNMQYRHEYDVAPNDYYYNDPQVHCHSHTRVPKTHAPLIQSTSSCRYTVPHAFYPSCPLANSTSYHGTAVVNQGPVLNTVTSPNPGTALNQGEYRYIPKAGTSVLYQEKGINLPKNVGVSNPQGLKENYNAAQDYNDNFEKYNTLDQNRRTAYRNRENYAEFNEKDGTVYQNRQYYDSRQGKAYQAPDNYDQTQIKSYQTQKNYIDYEKEQGTAYQNPENFGDNYNTGSKTEYVPKYEACPFVECKGKKFSYYGMKGTNMKKYPVTVKTPKYITKNQATQLIHKRPSALCLSRVTQLDPGLVKRKSKTHHNLKKSYDQCEPLPQNSNEATTANYSYSAHQMHSEGDMNQNAMEIGLDGMLDQFEHKMGLNQDTGDGQEVGDININKIKEFSKFLKPRVPSSIKLKQERIAKMKSSLNMTGAALQPKMKVSLDKLLNRLQKCELSESAEKMSVKSTKSKKLDDIEKTSESQIVKHKSFNYETLTRKLSPRRETPEEESKIIPNKPSTSVTTSLDNKMSSSLLRPLDDHCAIDLHRSKSYIVDLIDRALSKELGTVPRGQIQKNMTPKRAVTTINRHRQSNHNELCYEVTAALTDSFISNATAPSKDDLLSQSLKRCESDCDKKLCKSFSDDVNYIKQLKQLRWGHIRHIQHEARKLADLEEFLEKCGEITY